MHTFRLSLLYGSRKLMSATCQGIKGKSILAFILLIAVLLNPAMAQDPAQEEEKDKEKAAKKLEKLDNEIKELQKKIEKAEAEKHLKALVEPEEKEVNEEKEKADKEAAVLNAKASKAEAQKKLLGVQLPPSTTTPLEGTVTLNDVSFEVEIMAHKAMDGIARDIST